ncbi:MAG: Gfo/Idh/MocA family oxidoreductase [Planctomycetales bacterium]|nr:Gfo/Idh/MocA family oxidoreductase [Planctomycetales bacterium]
MAKIRWGILGCGDIANKRVAEAIQIDPNSELVAACRRDAMLLDEFCRRFAVTKSFTGATELIDSAEIDAVYVATPVHLHRQNVLDAARAGKHVLVEKPMALNGDECDEMITACAEAGVTLSVAYYRRFYPIVQRLRQLIASGQFGKPLSVLAACGNATTFPRDDWRVVKAQGGGGPLMDIGSHRLDLFLDLFGEVSSVKAFTENIVASHESEDAGIVTMKFSTGPIGILETYFGATDVPDRFQITCTRGAMFTDSLNDGELVLMQNGTTTRESHPAHRNLHAPLIADFTSAILDFRQPTVTGQQGAAVNKLIDRAYTDAQH